jgi:hypothetical protein
MFGMAIGATIGGLAGGLIDPQEFHGPDVQGPKIAEFQLMGVSEGAGIPKVYGHQVRLAGQLIAAGGIIETAHTSQNPVSSGKSFLAGTPVLMADGTTKPIEALRVGDKVQTAKVRRWKPSSPKIRCCQITKIHKGKTTRAFCIEGVHEDDSEAFKFTCTPEHEVYGYKGKGKPHWFQARGVKRGDALFTPRGWVWVSNVSTQGWSVKEEDGIDTFNLTVAKDHNYFAGNALVHNGGGGKEGEGGGTTTWYTYSSTLGVAICEGPIRAVDRIYVNGKTRYAQAVTYTCQVGVDSVTSLQVLCTATFTGYTGGHNPWFGEPDYTDGNCLFDLTVELISVGGTNPLGNFNTGLDVTTSNFATSGNNQTVVIKKREAGVGNRIELDVVGTSTYTGGQPYEGGDPFDPDQFSHSFGGFATETETTDAKAATTTITHNDDFCKAIQLFVGDTGSGDGVVYPADHSSNGSPSSILEALSGHDPSPAYKGTAYVAIEELELADFGNRIPQFHFKVDARLSEPNAVGTSYTRANQVIDSTLIRAGRLKQNGIGGAYTLGDDFDSDAFSETGGYNTVRGYAIAGARPTISILSNIVLRYDILASEEGGVLKFKRRGTEDTVAVTPTDIPAFTNPETADPPPKFGMTDQPITGLANEINIDYFDVNDKGQRASQKARKPTQSLPLVQAVEIPMFMTASEAQEVAVRMLQQSWSQRNMCGFTLPPNYVTVSEGDILTLDADGEAYKVRVLELNRGDDYLHEVKGLITESAISTYTGDADDGDPVTEGPYTPPTMLPFIFDCPALHTEGLLQTGHYTAAVTDEIDAEFQAASLFRSDTSGSGFVEICLLHKEAMIVKIDNAHELNRNRPFNTWDDTTEINVTVLGPESTSAPLGATDIQVLKHHNVLVTAHGEVIAYGVALPTGARTYKLTHLLRGRRSSEDLVERHGGANATATVTITNYANVDGGADKVGLVPVDAPEQEYVAALASNDFPNARWKAETSNDVTAANLAAAINFATGVHGERFTASSSGAVVTIRQIRPGTAGNTTVTLTDTGSAGMSKTDFTGGLNGTELACVVTYDGSQGIISAGHDPDSLFSTMYYKVVSSGADEADTQEVARECKGRRVRPFAVGNLRGYRDTVGPSATDDWIIQWARRDRSFFKLFSAANVPNIDIDEVYQARIINSVDGTTVRTIGMGSAGGGTSSYISATQFDSTGGFSAWPTLTYTTEDQTTDETADATFDASEELVVEIFKVGQIIYEGVNVRTAISADRNYSF